LTENYTNNQKSYSHWKCGFTGLGHNLSTLEIN